MNEKARKLMPPTPQSNSTIKRINQHLQNRLRKERREDVCAVEAARWLDEAKLLKDNPNRLGLPLRNLLRDEKIEILGQKKRPKDSRNRIWWIERVR